MDVEPKKITIGGCCSWGTGSKGRVIFDGTIRETTKAEKCLLTSSMTSV